MLVKKSKYYTIRKTSICNSGYGIFECENDNKCVLIACSYIRDEAT
ncbi:hypothetical protein J5U22_01853 [Saccharolobus shibatae]|uniref:Uncharacterized protein n=1 Tax=Saccharolobus shibatae TaxID=2286 RepID=A0A8F5C1F9_9CREN|nr:hypothetical protein J5U22_01853 [Saccharolobus shibatae]